jgi:hypothetical protein
MGGDKVTEGDQNLLFAMKDWFEENRINLANRGFSLNLRETPKDGRPKLSSFVDIDFEDRMGRITLWSTGEVEITVLEVSTEQDVVNQHRQVNSTAELHNAFEFLLESLRAT